MHTLLQLVGKTLCWFDIHDYRRTPTTKHGLRYVCPRCGTKMYYQMSKIDQHGYFSYTTITIKPGQPDPYDT